MGLSEPLSLRLENGTVLISDDHGSSWTAGGRTAEAIRRLLQDDGFARADISVATVAGLAEAKSLRPVSTEPGDGRGEPVSDPKGVPVGVPGLPSRPLAEVLADRRSERTFASLTLDELGEILVRCGRVRLWRELADGGQEESRALPSAGAKHPVHFEVVSRDVVGLDPGHWRFDHARCQLVPISEAEPEARVEKMLERLEMVGGVAAVVFAVAEFPRTLNRYPAGASLVWRDAGVVLCGLQLCATDLNLVSCILAPAGVLYPDGHARSAVDVGAVALGGRSGDDDLV